MVDIKEAMNTARNKIKEVYGQEPTNFQVEEIEQSEDGKCWVITVGFNESPPMNPQNELQRLSFLLRPPVRVYRVIKINLESGDFISMKMREAQAA